MSFLESVKTCVQKYATISGRASRSEFWWFYLFTCLVTFVAGLFDIFVLGYLWEDAGPAELISNIALLLPILSATVRRLHDTGRSGALILVPIAATIAAIAIVLLAESTTGGTGLILAGLVVLAAFIVLIVWLCLASEPGANRFGPNPFEDNSGSALVEVFQ